MAKNSVYSVGTSNGKISMTGDGMAPKNTKKGSNKSPKTSSCCSHAKSTNPTRQR